MSLYLCLGDGEYDDDDYKIKRTLICDPICENPALRKSEKRVVQRILQRNVCALQRFAKRCQRFNGPLNASPMNPTLSQQFRQRFVSNTALL